MRIENLRSERKGGRARIAATVTWEDCDRLAEEVYFETDDSFADSLSCNPHAFLVACVIPALHYGEKRVAIDAEICPVLREGLVTAMSWLRLWYYEPDRDLVRIEAKTRPTMAVLRTPERAGFFLSGGIDSFSTLQMNRLNFPPQHPWSIRDGLLAYGLELDDANAFDYVVRSLSEVADEANITLLPVYTNVYLNYRAEDAKDDFRFWQYEFSSAALAAIAHAFARRLSVVSIACDVDIPTLAPRGMKHLNPWGSHPLLEPNYGSTDLQIRTGGLTLSRLEKTKLVVDWDVALQHIRVCNQYRRYRPDMLNCGECDKCMMTMLALLALGVLDRTRAFSSNDITEEDVVKAVNIHSRYHASCFRELINPLLEKGRHDLVRVIKSKIRKAKYGNPKADTWKNGLKGFDAKYLGGYLRTLKRPTNG